MTAEPVLANVKLTFPDGIPPVSGVVEYGESVTTQFFRRTDEVPVLRGAARTIAAVAVSSVMSSGTDRTWMPGMLAASVVCTSQPSSSPPSDRAP